MVNIKFRTNTKRLKINKINNVYVVKWISSEKEKSETRVRISFEFRYILMLAISLRKDINSSLLSQAMGLNNRTDWVLLPSLENSLEKDNFDFKGVCSAGEAHTMQLTKDRGVYYGSMILTVFV